MFDVNELKVLRQVIGSCDPHYPGDPHRFRISFTFHDGKVSVVVMDDHGRMAGRFSPTGNGATPEAAIQSLVSQARDYLEKQETSHNEWALKMRESIGAASSKFLPSEDS